MTSSVAPALRLLTDRRGRPAAEWATAPLVDARRVLEIVPDGAAIGLAAGTGRARAMIDRLPLADNAVDGLCLTGVLATAADLDALFVEVRRILRPAGTLVVVTPSALVRSPGQLRVRAVHRRGWPHRSALDGAGWLLAAADFAVLADDRATFGAEVPAGAAERLAAQLSAGGLWPPQVPAGAVARLAATAGARWPVPLRRLIARR